MMILSFMKSQNDFAILRIQVQLKITLFVMGGGKRGKHNPRKGGRTMKKKAFLAIGVLLCAMFLLGMAPNEARAAFDIHFIQPDGTPYCDGMLLDFSGGQVYGNWTGCSSGTVFGDLALTFKPIQGFLLAIAASSGNLIGMNYLKFDRKFINYWASGIGDPPWPFASGTWDFGPPALEARDLPSIVPK